MNLQMLIGILLMAGLLLMIASSVAGPPGLFLASNRESQLKIIDKYPSRFKNISILAALAGIVTATGLILLARLFAADENAVQINVAAAGFTLGSLLFTVFYFLVARDPETYFEAVPTPVIAVAAFCLLVSSLALFGYAFVQGSLPNWLGYLHIGGMGVLAMLAVIYKSGFFTKFPPQTIFLFTFITGIVLLRLGNKI